MPLATAAALTALVLAGLGMLPAFAAAGPLTIELDKTQAAIGLGQTVKFTTKVGNPGEEDVSGAIAHLNILAVSPGVYVDPEDWSGERTQYLDPLGGGESEPLEWELQGVNSGRFMVYVVVTFDQAAGQVTASKALGLDVAPERTLEASGLVPIAAGVPGAIVVLMGLVMVRRRRHSSTPGSDAGIGAGAQTNPAGTAPGNPPRSDTRAGSVAVPRAHESSPRGLLHLLPCSGLRSTQRGSERIPRHRPTHPRHVPFCAGHEQEMGDDSAGICLESDWSGLCPRVSLYIRRCAELDERR